MTGSKVQLSASWALLPAWRLNQVIANGICRWLTAQIMQRGCLFLFSQQQRALVPSFWAGLSRAGCSAWGSTHPFITVQCGQQSVASPIISQAGSSPHKTSSLGLSIFPILLPNSRQWNSSSERCKNKLFPFFEWYMHRAALFKKLTLKNYYL